ncbi:MAG: Sec-independent protein translocase subunit TatA [Actinomycetaceae bacterium]|nr:Sec-independent protein translocase subunit TatA [Actinomycetaceae bacterium]
MGAFKPWHIVIVLIVLVILFGANRLPNIAKNVGQSAKVLKKEMRELTEDQNDTKAAEETVVPPAVPSVDPEVTNNPRSEKPESTTFVDPNDGNK